MKDYYSIAFVCDSTIDERLVIDKIERLLKGKQYELKDDGVKTLAYAIGGHKQAHHYYAPSVKMTQAEALQLDNELRRASVILRYFMAKIDRAVKIEYIIENWVRDNFGDSEADNPSWNIALLAQEIDSKLEREGMECYNSGWQDGYREALDKVLDGINRNRQEADREGDITYLEDNSSGWSDVENLIEECRNE